MKIHLLLFSLFSGPNLSDSRVRESESKNSLINAVERDGFVGGLGQAICDLMAWCCNQACAN